MRLLRFFFTFFILMYDRITTNADRYSGRIELLYMIIMTKTLFNIKVKSVYVN